MTEFRLSTIFERYPFARYLVVGGLGFLIDAALMELMVNLSVSIYIARALSMSTAAFICYHLHRHFTFAQRRMVEKMPETPGQLSAFLASQFFSALLNYSVFCLMLWVLQRGWFYALVPGWGWLPPAVFFARMGALCAGVGVGLVTNYVLVKRVFVHGLRLPGLNDTLLFIGRPGFLWGLVLMITGGAIFSLQCQILQWPHITAPFPQIDSDIWLRLAQVKQWMQPGDGFFDHGMPRANAPFGGLTTPWTRPVDMLLYAIAWLLPADMPINMRLMLAAAWYAPLLGLGALWFLSKAAARGLRHRYVFSAMVCMALLCPFAHERFNPGDADHHGLMALLWCATLWIMMDPLTRGRAVVLGGICGTMLWISPETLITTAGVYAVLGVLSIKGGIEEIENLFIVMLAAAVVSFLALFVEVPAANILTFQAYDTLSFPYVALMSFCALGAAFLVVAFRRFPQPRARLAAAGIAGAAILSGLVIFYPHMLGGPMVDADPYIIDHYLRQIAEAVPVYRLPRAFLYWMLVLPELAAVLVGVAFYMKPSPPRKRRLVMLAAFIALTTFMLMSQCRWFYYAEPVAILAIAWLLPGVLRKFSRHVFAVHPALILAVVLALVPHLIVFNKHIMTQRAQAQRRAAQSTGAQERWDSCIINMHYVMQTQQLQRLLGDKPLTVLFTRGSNGGPMMFFTPYKVIVVGYHREGYAMRVQDELFFSKTFAQAAPILEARGVDAAFICPQNEYPGTWFSSLTETGPLPAGVTRIEGMKLYDEKGGHPLLLRFNLPRRASVPMP